MNKDTEAYLQGYADGRRGCGYQNVFQDDMEAGTAYQSGFIDGDSDRKRDNR